MKQGQRVLIDMQNKTAMAHPMHLHGHAFQVVELNGKPLKGALRDTVLVPPLGGGESGLRRRQPRPVASPLP